MKTKIVVISSNMNNFDIIPQGAEIGDYLVFTHTSPSKSVINGGISFNFDLLITDNIGHNGIEKYIEDNHKVVLTRHPKDLQAILINKHVSSVSNIYNTSKFFPTKTWDHGQRGGLSLIASPKENVVIKTEHGARGIGQLLVRVDRIPFLQFISLFDQYRANRITLADFEEKVKKFDPDFSVSSGTENHDGEGIDMLKNQAYVCQAFIDDIEKEYRLITNYEGVIEYVQERAIKTENTSFPQATGSSSNSLVGSDIRTLTEILDSESVKLLESIAKEVIGPLNSIDLFVRKDGSWGIFEHCNQFGITGVPYETAYKLHADFLKHCLDKLD